MPLGKSPRPPASGAAADTKPQTAAAAKSSGSRTFRFADRFSRWIALAFVFVTTVLLITPSLFYRSVKYTSPAENDIYSAISFAVPDEVKKEAQIREKEKQAPYFYSHETLPYLQAEKKLADLFEKAQDIVERGADVTTDVLVAQLMEFSQNKLELPLEKESAQNLLAHAADEGLKGKILAILSHLYMERGIIDDISRYRAYDKEKHVQISTPAKRRPSNQIITRFLLEPSRIRTYLESNYFAQQRLYSLLTSEQQQLALSLSLALSQTPNIAFDAERTDEYLQEQKRAIANRLPLKEYPKGSLLFAQGENVDYGLLEEMQEVQSQVLYKRLATISLYTMLLISLVFYYVRQFKPDLSFNTRNVLLVAAPVLLALILGRILLETFRYPDVAAYMFPAGIIGMLTVVILLDARLGILLVTVGSLAFSIATNQDFKVFITALLGGYAGVYALSTVKERRDVLRAGLIVGIVNTIIIFLIHFIDDPMMVRANIPAWGFGNGLMCGILALPLLYMFEEFFGITTDVRLLELTGLDHPLLRMLEEKAPGSYQHSLGVVKLAEAAARDIGANYLLVRAGAYFHDIGKILKPKYFGENQISLEEKSLHSKLSPYMSAMVIKNHVKAGIELAKQKGLPQRVVDFIPEHQGTTIITWPYHEALKRFQNSESMDPVREEDFRYPGPKPQSIETAIVMLADTVEATATSRFTSLSVNEDELRVTVQKTIADKFNDGQFDECDLTLRDLHQIRESFIRTLISRFHTRIGYPSLPAHSGPAGPSPKREKLERQ